MRIFWSSFSISKAATYLLSFILISFVIYIVYKSLKQSNNELEKYEERFEQIVKDLANQHKEDEKNYKDLENKLSEKDDKIRFLENKLNEVPQGTEKAAGIARNDIEETKLDLSTKKEGGRKAPNYHFTAHMFFPEKPQWQRLITEFKGKGKEINVLEIGVFEGKCTVWILENLFDNPKSLLLALDTFKGSVENTGSNGVKTWGYMEDNVLEEMEKTFRNNIEQSGFKNQVEVMKGISYNSLLKLNYDKLQFDITYIDGSHSANDVLADAILAWPLLKINGIMIFDDYEWNMFKEEYNKPRIAIDTFLACYAYEIELLEKNYQIAIRKVKKERSYTRQ